MGLDYREFKRFADSYSNIAFKFDAFLKDFLLKCALEVLAKTKKRTPVDTGALKKNWFLTNIETEGDEFVIYICNDMEYATFMEYGHTNRNRTKWSEGYFMATISIEEVQRKIPKRFEREFEKFILSLEVR